MGNSLGSDAGSSGTVPREYDSTLRPPGCLGSKGIYPEGGSY